MAKNYRISELKIIEKKGASVNNGTLTSTGVLNITPIKGHVISADSFSCKSPLPHGVMRVRFLDTKTKNTVFNNVAVLVDFDANFIVPNESVNILLDITGSSTQINSIGLEATIVLEDPKDSDSVFSSVTLTAINSSTITTTNNYIGQAAYNNDNLRKIKDRHVIACSSVPSNKRIKIAQLYFKADDGYYFLEKPKLQNNNNADDIVKLKLTKTEVDSTTNRLNKQQITGYYFDVTYKNNEKTNIASNITSKLIYSAIAQNAISSSAPVIESVDFGRTTISTSGETRRMVVRGTPGAKFKITLTRKSTGESILDNSYINSVSNDPVTGVTHAFTKEIPMSGYCYFDQEFPNTTVNTTTVTSAMSSTATMPLADTTGIQKGDKLIISSIDYASTTTVDSVDSATQVTLASSISAAEDASVSFVRSDEYYLNIEPMQVLRTNAVQNKTYTTAEEVLNDIKFETTLSSKIAERTNSSHARRDYNYLFTQNLKPILTISATEANANLNSSAATTVTRIGIADKVADSIKSTVHPSKFSVSWSLTAHNAHNKVRTNTAGGVNENGVISFSNTDQTASDFTNSVPASNGGTELLITNIFQTDTSKVVATTYLITFDVIVIKWGTTDTTISLDLDQILTTLSA